MAFCFSATRCALRRILYSSSLPTWDRSLWSQVRAETLRELMTPPASPKAMVMVMGAMAQNTLPKLNLSFKTFLTQIWRINCMYQSLSETQHAIDRWVEPFLPVATLWPSLSLSTATCFPSARPTHGPTSCASCSCKRCGCETDA